ncbi:MAG: hypothetical protein WCO52_01855 [bacterium]
MGRFIREHVKFVLLGMGITIVLIAAVSLVGPGPDGMSAISTTWQPSFATEDDDAINHYPQEDPVPGQEVEVDVSIASSGRAE